MRFMEFAPDWMKAPAFPNQTKLGDQGQNLPAVLKEICADPKRKRILADWIDKLTPMDVRGFEFPSDPSGRTHLKIQEFGIEIGSITNS